MRVTFAAVVILLAVPSAFAEALPAQPNRTQLTTAEALEAKADQLFDDRKLDEALTLLEQALARREKILGRRHASVATTLNSIGYVKFTQGDLPGAEAAFTRALAIRRRPPSRNIPDLAQSLNNLAQVYQEQGRMREVQPLLEQSLDIQRRAHVETGDLADAYNNLGGYFSAVGAYHRARAQLERALVLRERASKSSPASIGASLNNLGLVFQQLGELQRAQELYERALPIRKAGGENADLVRTLNNLASVLQEQGRLDAAEPFYRQAIDLAERLFPKGHPLLAQALSNYAVLNMLRRDFTRAEPLYRRALQMREDYLGSEHSDVATSLEAFAVFLSRTGRTAEALQVKSRADGIRERNLNLILEIGAETQKEQYLEKFRDSVDVALTMRSTSREAGEEADRLALLTVLRRKGRLQDLLASTSQALRSRGPTGAEGDVELLSRARASLARLVLQNPGGLTPVDRDARVKALSADVERLEARLSTRTAELGSSASSVSLETLQRAISPDAALIEFFRYRPFDPEALRSDTRFGPPKYVAYALRRDGAPVWTELGEAAPVDRALANFRAALKDPERSDAMARAAELRGLLTEPVERLAGTARHLILSPDSELNLLPFHVLTDANGVFLLQKYVISYVTSARELVRPADPNRTSESPLIISSPAFGLPRRQSGAMRLRFDPLPGTAEESRALAALLPDARTLSGVNASEERLKSEKHPRLLHVATHGFFLADMPGSEGFGVRGLRVPKGEQQFVPPLLRSGLALAGANSPRAEQREDGILTAAEAALLDLEGTDLVFLSACETGLGVINGGESVYGLRRAFVIAGARSQVLTLWQVSDDATQHFVVSFYKHLLDGASRAEALRYAQQEAIADPARRHPFYWAAFILSGESGALVRR